MKRKGQPSEKFSFLPPRRPTQEAPRGEPCPPVTCPECGFQGVVAAEDAGTHQLAGAFRLLSKDDRGNVRLLCPSCHQEGSYRVTALGGTLVRLSGLMVAGAVLAALCFLIRWLLFG